MANDPTKVLAGKWAVVTGSSSGIGRAIAIELAAAGANLIVHGHRHQDAAAQLAESLRASGIGTSFRARIRSRIRSSMPVRDLPPPATALRGIEDPFRSAVPKTLDPALPP